MSEPVDDQIRDLLAAAIETCSSVSKANLARRGEYLPSTLVNPFSLRRLADAVEAIAPGAIDDVRDGKHVG